MAEEASGRRRYQRRLVRGGGIFCRWGILRNIRMCRSRGSHPWGGFSGRLKPEGCILRRNERREATSLESGFVAGSCLFLQMMISRPIISQGHSSRVHRRNIEGDGQMIEAIRKATKGGMGSAQFSRGKNLNW